MNKSIGIIGNTGRIGTILHKAINKHPKFTNGIGFNRSQSSQASLEEIFKQNDYIIDFSKPELTEDALKAAIKHPKPLIICTTGWPQNKVQPMLDNAAQNAPIVIAPNTSIGAYLQRHLVKQLAKILGEEYDIDILDKHHRNKIDIPSGTTKQLIEDIHSVKKQHQGLTYQSYNLEKGPRPEHFIGVTAKRSGNLPGDHEVSFTSLEEMISIKHVAFDRSLFAKGALRIMEWIDNTKPKPGLYKMENVLNLI